jgi:hypothetical protein
VQEARSEAQAAERSANSVAQYDQRPSQPFQSGRIPLPGINEMKWIIQLYRYIDNLTIAEPVFVGVRVKTPYGPAVVVSGCLHVKLDKGYRKPNTHENDRHLAIQLDKVEVL